MITGLLIGAFVFVLGLCIGSFLNCAIYRVEQEKSFLKGRSFCPNCKHELNWKDLFPVFSYLFLAGKCRYCKAKISWLYPAVEISTALIFLLIFFSSPLYFNFQSFENWGIGTIWQFLSLGFWFYITSVLIFIFVYDLKHYLIPDKVLLPAIIVAIVYRLVFNFSLLQNYLIAILIGAGFFLAIFLVSQGRWMGFGDVKLAVLLGLITGFPNILVALFLAFFFGAVVGVALMIQHKKKINSEIPFGPFLIIGTFVAIFWGEILMDFYLNSLMI